MDERMPMRRDDAMPNRGAPTAPRTNDKAQNGRHGAEREYSNRSSSTKPALTERERNERWPVD